MGRKEDSRQGPGKRANRKRWFWYDTPLASGRTSMDEAEFDSLMPSRPFGREDAMRADVQLRHRMTLAIALRGRTLGDPQSQLTAQSLAFYTATCAWPYFAPRFGPAD